MNNEIVKVESAGRDARTRIVAFLNGERRVVLNSEEEKIMQRWQRAHELFETAKYTWNDIRDSLENEFKISKWTAENDLANAQEVYGKVRKLSKRYLIHTHLERLNKQIQVLHEKYFVPDKDGFTSYPDAKELAALSKLEEAYTYTLNSIPDDIEKRELPPPILVFKFAEGVVLNRPMSREEAIKAADEIIDIEYEETTDRPAE